MSKTRIAPDRLRRRDAARAITPTALIESQLSVAGEPVLGLYLHVAYVTVMSTFGSTVGRGEVTPAIIGILAMVAQRPGISQAGLARLMGLERATIGATVARAVAAGLIDRDDGDDGRRYALALSARGQRTLGRLRRRIAAHEKAAGSRLTPAERRQLRALLDKLVYG
jgi:DNA-binding MarR family transcriptional regulator